MISKVMLFALKYKFFGFSYNSKTPEHFVKHLSGSFLKGSANCRTLQLRQFV